MLKVPDSVFPPLTMLSSQQSSGECHRHSDVSRDHLSVVVDTSTGSSERRAAGLSHHLLGQST